METSPAETSPAETSPAETTKTETRKYELGKFDGLPEFRVELDYSGLVPVPIVQTRSTVITAIVKIEQLETASEEAWKAAGQGILVAGAGAMVAGMIPGGVAAAPMFMSMFGSYATSKGLNLVASQIQFYTETAYGDWELLGAKPAVAPAKMLKKASSADSNI